MTQLPWACHIPIQHVHQLKKGYSNLQLPTLMKVVTRLVNMVDIFSVSKSGTSLNAQEKKNASFIWTQKKVSFRP